MRALEASPGLVPRGSLAWIRSAAAHIDEHITDGRFQRSMALVATCSSFASGLEVGYEHYKGGYST